MREVLGRLSALLCSLAGCTGIPEGLEPVEPFDVRRYLGTWYEIARLDHSFERGLEDVSATYSEHAGGGIRVVNRGFDPAAGEWREAVGRAHPLGEPDQATFRVSFFGPFYGGYHVIALDDEYATALVTGSSRSYLWILAREKEMAPARRDELISIARKAGFPVEELVWVTHGRADPALERPRPSPSRTAR